MAKASAKKASKKSTASAITEIAGGRLTAKQMASAKKCIERTGNVKFGFKDVTVTRLPKSIAPVLVFVD